MACIREGMVHALACMGDPEPRPTFLLTSPRPLVYWGASGRIVAQLERRVWEERKWEERKWEGGCTDCGEHQNHQRNIIQQTE